MFFVDRGLGMGVPGIIQISIIRTSFLFMFTTILPQLIDVNGNTKPPLLDNVLGMGVPGNTCADGAVNGVSVP